MAEYRGEAGGRGQYTEGGERSPGPQEVQGHEGGGEGEREGGSAGGGEKETGSEGGATEGSGFGGRGRETGRGEESTTRPESQHKVTEADGFNGGLSS